MKTRQIAKVLLAIAACSALSGFAAPTVPEPDIPLRPTAEAPPGASGVARFETENGAATLAITVQGLSPGPYRLSAVKKSDQSVVALGPIVITDPAATPGATAGGSRKERSTPHQPVWLKFQTKVSLPSDLSLADVAEIKVARQDGVILLSGRPPHIVHPEQQKSGP